MAKIKEIFRENGSDDEFCFGVLFLLKNNENTLKMLEYLVGMNSNSEEEILEKTFEIADIDVYEEDE